MKRIAVLYFLLSLITVTAGAQLRQQLLDRLSDIQSYGYMVGHQDDPFYGMDWNGDLGRSDTKEAAGDYPAVMGFDLGGIEMDDEKFKEQLILLEQACKDEVSDMKDIVSRMVPTYKQKIEA